MKNITEIVKKTERPVKVLQFGEGNFLRAFVDWIIDNLNEKTDFNGNVMMVQPLANGMGDMINAQDGLYTTCLRGIQNGKPVEQFRQITSVAGCINPYSEYDKFIAQASNPDLRFIISNTTEAGIAYRKNSQTGLKTHATSATALSTASFRAIREPRRRQSARNSATRTTSSTQPKSSTCGSLNAIRSHMRMSFRPQRQDSMSYGLTT